MSANLQTPLKRARSLGSAKSGVHHWLVQRLTAVALVGLGIWFVILVLGLVHSNYLLARLTLAKPFNAITMIAFMVMMFWHVQLGLQVVVEDYVHTRWRQVTLQTVIKFLCLGGALTSVFAVLRIAFGH